MGPDAMSSRAHEMFMEVFESLPRQGPGNLASTLWALSRCQELPRAPQILDLGCGSGAQTLHLAAATDGSIVAIDRHPPLVERLRAAVEARGLGERVEARVADMAALDLPPERFDLVWSEGALYHLGLEAALPMCRRLLRPGGYLAFTEAVWRTADPPREVREAFADYPAMGRAEDVRSLLEATGFAVIDELELPPEAWWDDFYAPMERRIASLRAKHAGDAGALAALDEVAREPAMHRRCGHCYGYTFFVARRP